MTTTVNATLPQNDTYVKMVKYATNLKLTVGSGSHLHFGYCSSKKGNSK